MLIAFVLSMPHVGSWNGRWTGADNLYARVFNVGKSKKVIEKYTKLAEGSYYYNFGDGWSASVKVKEVTAEEARLIRRKTKGFCGYDWMISSIRCKGIIEA